MLLDGTTDTIQFLLDAAVTTTELSFNSYFNDYTSTSATPVNNQGASNGTTAVDLVGSPAASHQRELKSASIYNEDTTSKTVTIQIFDGTNTMIVYKALLAAGETMQYKDDYGWHVNTTTGDKKVRSGHVMLPGGNIHMIECFPSAGSSSTIVLGTTTGIMSLGKAEKDYTSIDVQYRVSNAAASITWAELGIYKASQPTGAGTQHLLRRCGYTDTSTPWQSTGQKTTNVVVSNVKMGDELFVLFSNSAGTSVQIRGGNITDPTSAYTMAVSSSGFRLSLAECYLATAFGGTPGNLWVAWHGN